MVSDGMHGSRNGSTSADMSFSSEDMQGCDISVSIPTTTLSGVHILLRLKRMSRVRKCSTKTVSRARVCVGAMQSPTASHA